jgi:hypothetical protein
MKVVREGTVTLENGVTLHRACEIDCGCIFGVDPANQAFVIKACSPTCEVYEYASGYAAKSKKPIGMMVETTSRKEYDDLMRRTKRAGGIR